MHMFKTKGFVLCFILLVYFVYPRELSFNLTRIKSCQSNVKICFIHFIHDHPVIKCKCIDRRLFCNNHRLMTDYPSVGAKKQTETPN